MIRRTLAVLSCSTLLSLPGLALAASIGQPAPAFNVANTTGKTHTLADYKGKYVVLEWVNPGCPFVRKHYDSDNMQSTQRKAASAGAVWLAVNSTSRNSGDYLAPDAMSKWMSEQKAAATATLMDTDGSIGKAYGARTTPHMYIIDPQGTLIYAGAIDSKPTARIDDIASATNYISTGLGEATTGKPITTAITRAYGCSIKYD